MTQSVVIIEILVTQSQSKDTLADQCRNIMHHQMLGARVLETLGQPIRHAGDTVGTALQKNPGVGGDRTPGKVGFYAASVASGHLTCELGCSTDCINRGNVLSYIIWWKFKDYTTFPLPCQEVVVESGAGAPVVWSGGLSVAFAPCLQFGSLDRVSSPPLIKPDVLISRIRLTDEITLARVIRAGVSDT